MSEIEIAPTLEEGEEGEISHGSDASGATARSPKTSSTSPEDSPGDPTSATSHMAPFKRIWQFFNSTLICWVPTIDRISLILERMGSMIHDAQGVASLVGCAESEYALKGARLAGHVSNFLGHTSSLILQCHGETLQNQNAASSGRRQLCRTARLTGHFGTFLGETSTFLLNCGDEICDSSSCSGATHVDKSVGNVSKCQETRELQKDQYTERLVSNVGDVALLTYEDTKSVITIDTHDDVSLSVILQIGAFVDSHCHGKIAKSSLFKAKEKYGNQIYSKLSAGRSELQDKEEDIAKNKAKLQMLENILQAPRSS